MAEVCVFGLRPITVTEAKKVSYQFPHITENLCGVAGRRLTNNNDGELANVLVVAGICGRVYHIGRANVKTEARREVGSQVYHASVIGGCGLSPGD